MVGGDRSCQAEKPQEAGGHLVPVGSKVPPSHPRHDSLVTRERLVQGAREGVVAWEGLLAHGRGEAFDYLLGERTVPEAVAAERAAVAYLLQAERAVISVNGNVAVLAPTEVKRLAAATGARVEVNLFHRTEERVAKIVDRLHAAGIPDVLGLRPDGRIPGLESDRALCAREGILAAGAVLVPLEDGDRAEALVRMGKLVLAIDLNPLSRTSQTATVAVVDEVTRAMANMARFADEADDTPQALEEALGAYDKERNLAGVLRRIAERLAGPQGP